MRKQRTDARRRRRSIHVWASIGVLKKITVLLLKTSLKRDGTFLPVTASPKISETTEAVCVSYRLHDAISFVLQTDDK